MEVVINRNGDIVSSTRGTFYAGSKNSKIVKLLASDDVFSLIPKQSRIVHINISRPDGEQTGWELMKTEEDGVYFYILQDWELSVPGEIAITFEIVNSATSSSFTTEEVKAIVKNGVIAQPACDEDHTVLEGYYQNLNELAQKAYDVNEIDTYNINFSSDGLKTQGLYRSYSHTVVDSILSETEEKVYDTVVGVLQVSSVSLENYDSQTETLFANGRAWVRELKFEGSQLVGSVTDFEPLGYGAVGPRGYTGEQGEQGEKGDKGDRGSLWYSGQGQPSQSVGVEGDLYLRTDGDFNGYVYKKTVVEDNSEAIWKLVETIRGPQGEKGEKGPQGEQGIQGIQGIQGPIGPQGKDGKDGTSFDVWGKYSTLDDLKEAHPTGVTGQAYAVGIVEPYLIYTWFDEEQEWVPLGSIQGPKGDQGEIGPQGPQGNTGAQGPQGETGPQGEQGIQGKSFNPCGEWNSETSYQNTNSVIDVFTYQGKLYYTKSTAPQGTVPTNTTYFGVLLESLLFNGTGTSTNGAMTQKATTEALEALETSYNKLKAKTLNKNSNLWELDAGVYKIFTSSYITINYSYSEEGYTGVRLRDGSLLFVLHSNSNIWSFTAFNAYDRTTLGTGYCVVEGTDSSGTPTFVSGTYSFGTYYPIGAVYISIDNTSPASLFGGVWEQLPSGYALWTASSGAGTTISAGLPNIQGNFYVGGSGITGNDGPRIGGAIRNGDSGTISGEAGGGGGNDNKVYFNAYYGDTGTDISNGATAHESLIYGNSETVQPPAYKIYAWRRVS